MWCYPKPTQVVFVPKPTQTTTLVMYSSLVALRNCNVKPKLTGSNMYNVTKHGPLFGLNLG